MYCELHYIIYSAHQNKYFCKKMKKKKKVPNTYMRVGFVMEIIRVCAVTSLDPVVELWDVTGMDKEQGYRFLLRPLSLKSIKSSTH